MLKGTGHFYPRSGPGSPWLFVVSGQPKVAHRDQNEERFHRSGRPVLPLHAGNTRGGAGRGVTFARRYSIAVVVVCYNVCVLLLLEDLSPGECLCFATCKRAGMLADAPLSLRGLKPRMNQYAATLSPGYLARSQSPKGEGVFRCGTCHCFGKLGKKGLRHGAVAHEVLGGFCDVEVTAVAFVCNGCFASVEG